MEDFPTPEHDAMVELPFVAVAEERDFGKVCFTCFRQLTHPMRCGKCKQASYCSKKCQAEDWKSHQHKIECSILAEVANGDLIAKQICSAKDSRILLRCCSRLLMEELSGSPMIPENHGFPTDMKIRSASDYRDSSYERSGARKMEMSVFYTTLQVFMMQHPGAVPVLKHVDENILMKAGSLLSTVCLFKLVPFHLNVDNVGIAAGHAIYLQASRFKHTCGIPDLHRRMVGSKMKLRPVDKNLKITADNIDSLTISYITQVNAMHMETKYRKAKLKDIDIECSCSSCQDANGDMILEVGLKETCGRCGEPLCFDIISEAAGLVRKICIRCGFLSEMSSFQEAKHFNSLMAKAESILTSHTQNITLSILNDYCELTLRLSDIGHPTKNRSVLLMAHEVVTELFKANWTKEKWLSLPELKKKAMIVMGIATKAFEDQGRVYSVEYRTELKQVKEIYTVMGEAEKAKEAEDKIQQSINKYC